MLKQLDTFIGFVVVMSVVSLLITIITQMVSSLLGLRGKNLSDALQAMIHKIAPTITQRSDGLATQLANRILTHPVISDSILSMKPNFLDRIRILAWLRRKWRVASAIRPDELFAILQDLACASPDAAASLDKKKDIWKIADDAVEAMADPEKRTGLLAGWIEETARIHEASQAAADTAKEAAEKLDASSPTERHAALKEAIEKGLAAKTTNNLSAHAIKIVEKIEDTLKDDAKAREFAGEAPIRAAATKLLAALYVPPDSPMISATNASVAEAASGHSSLSATY
jgi:hypothetical protein